MALEYGPYDVSAKSNAADYERDLDRARKAVGQYTFGRTARIQGITDAHLLRCRAWVAQTVSRQTDGELAPSFPSEQCFRSLQLQNTRVNNSVHHSWTRCATQLSAMRDAYLIDTSVVSRQAALNDLLTCADSGMLTSTALGNFRLAATRPTAAGAAASKLPATKAAAAAAAIAAKGKANAKSAKSSKHSNSKLDEKSAASASASAASPAEKEAAALAFVNASAQRPAWLNTLIAQRDLQVALDNGTASKAQKLAAGRVPVPVGPARDLTEMFMRDAGLPVLARLAGSELATPGSVMLLANGTPLLEVDRVWVDAFRPPLVPKQRTLPATPMTAEQRQILTAAATSSLTGQKKI